MQIDNNQRCAAAGRRRRSESNYQFSVKSFAVSPAVCDSIVV